MARPRDSRSPSPAGSYASRKRQDDRRDRYRDNHRDRPRSRSPDRRYRDRNPRDGDRDRRDYDTFRRRDRSLERDRRDDYRGGRRDGNRDRRRSRDRPRSPDRRRPRSREGDRDPRPRRDDSRDRLRDRREDVDTTPRRPDSRAGDRGTRANSKEVEPAKSANAQAQSEADKKAERLRKIQAMKQKHAMKAQGDAGTTRKLLAEMDQKASGSSPAPETPTTTEAAPYAGKFDPKAIAKSSKLNRAQSPSRLGATKLGDVPTQPAPSVPAIKAVSKAPVLSANKAVSGFGFRKGADSDKATTKRKLDMDDEETSNRKLAKLPDFSLETADDLPFVAQDEGDDDSDEMDFAKDEEEAAAAARAAHEKREERILQQSMAMQTDDDADSKAKSPAAPAPAPEPAPDAMQIDEDEEDPLDAFMAGLEPGAAPSRPKRANGKKEQEPEAYYSEDELSFKMDKTDAKSILALAAKRKKKDIPTVDYSKLELNPIRKNFWVEPYELSLLTEEETIDLRLELDGIKVSGKDVPKPVQKWSQCGLTRPILDTIDSLGYDKPTSIQAQALPVLMSGRDVIGVAKTGSGKTMAFLLPMFRHIKDQDPLSGDDGPVALIMTPTRELAVQIHRDCKPFLRALNLRAVAAYGGAPIKDQIAELKRGAEIVVATPGRMIDLLAANQGRVTNLRRATYLVLDEADRMFDMGFEPQVMKIFNNVRPDRQTILFSATMPRIIDALTKKVLREPVEITVGGRSVVAPEITQIVEIRDEKDKFVRLLELLGELYANDEDVRALIFVERQEKADELLRELLRRGYGCMSLHGGKDQVDRDSTITDFKSGICPIMIATSVAARGLDVKQLKLVINYDAPNHLEDYVHRAGRTGRAGNTGTAVTFVTEEQENCAPGIAKALEQSGQPIPERLAEMRKAFRDKVKAGKAKDTTGFGGKGLEKLDKDREAARLRERKTHKTEGDEEDTKEEDTKEDEKAEKAKSAALTAASAIVSRDAARKDGDEKPVVVESTTPTAAATSASTPAGGALDKASSVINEINKRLARAGQLRPGQPVDNKGPDAGAYHATLEINDFPQKARWAVTNRTNVAKILEATGTSITNKGNFYPPGKEPTGTEEPKLYILIEGDTEVSVGNALQELTRLLKEGTMAAADAESRAPASGRYTIT